MNLASVADRSEVTDEATDSNSVHSLSSGSHFESPFVSYRFSDLGSFDGIHEGAPRRCCILRLKCLEP